MRDHLDVKPWMLIVIVVAIVVPISAGFIAGGPLVGLPTAAAVALAIVAVAIRLEPRRTHRPRHTERDRRPRH